MAEAKILARRLWLWYGVAKTV